MCWSVLSYATRGLTHNRPCRAVWHLIVSGDAVHDAALLRGARHLARLSQFRAAYRALERHETPPPPRPCASNPRRPKPSASEPRAATSLFRIPEWLGAA
eukprot:6350514-Prymnesium_polylepis.2